MNHYIRRNIRLKNTIENPSHIAIARTLYNPISQRFIRSQPQRVEFARWTQRPFTTAPSPRLPKFPWLPVLIHTFHRSLMPQAFNGRRRQYIFLDDSWKFLRGSTLARWIWIYRLSCRIVLCLGRRALIFKLHGRLPSIWVRLSLNPFYPQTHFQQDIGRHIIWCLAIKNRVCSNKIISLRSALRGR